MDGDIIFNMVSIFPYGGSGLASPQSPPSSHSLASDQSHLLHCPGQIPHHTRSHPPIQERCSSAVITGQCRGSRPTCGDLSPICLHTGDDSSSVFSPSPWRQFAHTESITVSSGQSVTSIVSSVAGNLRTRLALQIFCLLWAAVSFLLVGLFIGLTWGWITPYGIAACSALFISALCLLGVTVTCFLACPRGVGSRSGYETVLGVDSAGVNNNQFQQVGEDSEGGSSLEYTEEYSKILNSPNIC